MADIVARDLADAPQTVLQSAAVYRKRQGGGVVVTAAVEALAQRQYQLGAMNGVVVDQPAKPLSDEALHRGRVVRHRQYLVDPDARRLANRSSMAAGRSVSS
jgi:hypothetical protein